MKRLFSHRKLLTVVSLAALMALSAGVAQAGKANGSFSFSWHVPGIGSATYDHLGDKMWTTSNYYDINVKYSSIPSDTWTKAVRCSDKTNIDGDGRLISAGDYNLRVIANGSLFRDGMCYYANLNGPSPSSYDVAGAFKS